MPQPLPDDLAMGRVALSVRDLERSKTELQEKILDLEKFEEVVVGRELKMIALEKEVETLRQQLERTKPERTHP